MLRYTILRLTKSNSALKLHCNARSISTKHYDIIIVGGGLVGTTLACTLGKNPVLSDKKILLLEASKKHDYKPSKNYSNRVSALNKSTYKLLHSNGIWSHIERSRYGEIKEIIAWESDTNAVINFDKTDNMAYVVENDLILHGAYSELNQNIELLNEIKIANLELNNPDKTSVLRLENGNEYTASLLLGCDGWKSKVREKMGENYISWDYQRMGVVATLEFEREHENNVAYQKFFKDGPIALLPLNRKLSSLVWSTTPSHARELLEMSEQNFVETLNQALFEQRNIFSGNSLIAEGVKFLNNFSKQGETQKLPHRIVKINENSRASFPLGFGHAVNYVQKGVALVGDAAHRVHPLAGQGVNLGFGDVSCLNSVLTNAVYSGSELGDILYLKHYETERQIHNIPTMLAIEGLHRIYSIEYPPLVLLRSMGLQTVNMLKPLKEFLQNRAAM